MDRHLIIILSYHICISFIFSSLHYNIMYSSWLATYYSCLSFTVSMWSYHWWFRYLFVSVPLWEWTYNNPWYMLGYCCNYCFAEWNTCWERERFPRFSIVTPDDKWISLLLEMAFGPGLGFRNPWPWWILSLLIRLAQIWSSKHWWWQRMYRWWLLRRKHDHTQSEDQKKFHSTCYWDIWVFSFPFWFIFDRLYINHYCTSLTIFFNPLVAYFFIVDNTCP
jgi:hypothetical protein